MIKNNKIKYRWLKQNSDQMFCFNKAKRYNIVSDCSVCYGTVKYNTVCYRNVFYSTVKYCTETIKKIKTQFYVILKKLN